MAGAPRGHGFREIGHPGAAVRIRVPSDCAGFTLAELLVACSISLVLGAAGFLFFRTQLRTLTDQSATLDAIVGRDYPHNYLQQKEE